ncbi:MAG TPA: SWIM zinc finger family protein [Ktedonobacteraceae bacterium]|nr:SWIM zinc finger family protein [Ktedonobacteraceae bacterium]
MGRWRPRYEWEDYYPESRPIRVQGGLKTKSERGAIGETWWSKRWLHTLEAFGMGARLTRGRSYARQGQVLSIKVEAGLVKAQVQGSSRQPYKITIRLQPLSDRDWEQVTEALASQAIFAAQLLAGEMPRDIEQAFATVNLSLFPTMMEDLQTNCSCPDWANPCKHIAAVYYILAEQFDVDPFLLFKLRGRTKEAMIEALRKKRVAALPAEASSAPEATSADNASDDSSLLLEDFANTFWQAGEELETFVVNPTQPEVDKAVLKRLGDAPFSVGKKNLRVLLAQAYDAVDAAASRRAAATEALES